MIKLRIAEILQEKGISKTEFAERMCIKKQNVNVLLETNNIRKLEEMADVLGVQLTDLWHDETNAQPSINGYIEFGAEVYAIKTVEDFMKLHQKLLQTL
jgi:DNA-binding Xre family transcriptional regulator